ncbi:serine protease family S01A, partial [Achlya hypogyna]
KKITKHPKFNYDTLVYDYAIIELETPTKVTPVEVYFDEDSANAPGVIATARGWGTTSSGGAQSNVLKEVGLKVWSNKDCQAAFDKLNNPDLTPLHSTMVCAGGIKGEDTCQGDSGGPLTVSKNGKDVLVGLTSWGLGCAQAGLPGVYSRLSQAKDFIAPYLPKPAC